VECARVGKGLYCLDSLFTFQCLFRVPWWIDLVYLRELVTSFRFDGCETLSLLVVPLAAEPADRHRRGRGSSASKAPVTLWSEYVSRRMQISPPSLLCASPFQCLFASSYEHSTKPAKNFSPSTTSVKTTTGFSFRGRLPPPLPPPPPPPPPRKRSDRELAN